VGRRRRFFDEDFLRHLAATTATRTYAKTRGKVIKAARSLAYRFLDLPVADRGTDTDVHPLRSRFCRHPTTPRDEF
jgi:hypothetical protein